MSKQKVYLETTLFNFYFDEDREAHADTVQLFEDIAMGKYEPYTSVYVIEELKKTQTEKRDRMIALVDRYSVEVLPLSKESEQLADIYVEEGIIPLKYRTDGVHIAVAARYDLDMIVSMNYQHIVKWKTKIGTARINALNGYRSVEILTPMELNEHEKT